MKTEFLLLICIGLAWLVKKHFDLSYKMFFGAVAVFILIFFQK